MKKQAGMEGQKGREKKEREKKKRREKRKKKKNQQHNNDSVENKQHKHEFVIAGHDIPVSQTIKPGGGAASPGLESHFGLRMMEFGEEQQDWARSDLEAHRPRDYRHRRPHRRWDPGVSA